MGTSRHLKPDATHSVTTDAGAIDAHIFEPKSLGGGASDSIRGTIVTVHPWAALGGGEHNTVGIARRIANEGGWRVVTFALESKGALWGILSAHSHEVQQTVDVVNFVSEKYGPDNVVLLGSSAGAPIAGTAMARLRKNGGEVAAYVAVGYTFGNFATLGFGRHFSSVVGNSAGEGVSPPKLYIMGERDEFTSVDQLEKMAKKMKANGHHVDMKIVADVGHFELESSSYDSLQAKMILDWLEKVLVS